MSALNLHCHRLCPQPERGVRNRAARNPQGNRVPTAPGRPANAVKRGSANQPGRRLPSRIRHLATNSHQYCTRRARSPMASIRRKRHTAKMVCWRSVQIQIYPGAASEDRLRLARKSSRTVLYPEGRCPCLPHRRAADTRCLPGMPTLLPVNSMGIFRNIDWGVLMSAPRRSLSIVLDGRPVANDLAAAATNQTLVVSTIRRVSNQLKVIDEVLKLGPSLIFIELNLNGVKRISRDIVIEFFKEFVGVHDVVDKFS